MKPATKRRRTRSRPAPTPEPIQMALRSLQTAVSALCDPQPAQLPSGRYTWLPARYTQLRDAIAHARISGHTHTPFSSLIPAQIDCLKLAITIDTRSHRLNPTASNTPTALQHLTTSKYRPHDTHTIHSTAAEITAWVKAIDDLFATKPLYLPDACPHCGHTHGHRIGDDGETIRTPALALTVEHGATCQNCHDTWPPDRLGILARMLGYAPLPGVIA